MESDSGTQVRTERSTRADQANKPTAQAHLERRTLLARKRAGATPPEGPITSSRVTGQTAQRELERRTAKSLNEHWRPVTDTKRIFAAGKFYRYFF